MPDSGSSLVNASGEDEHWTLNSELRVTDLRKRFESPGGETIEVLRGVSFSATAGESVAIMGLSGAGKSTLLHLLGGLESADHGSIRAGQFDISNARSSALASFRNSRIGFVFQFHNLISELSAVENVALPLMIARVSSGSARAQASSSLEETGLGSRISHPVAHLSGGEQQRVAVCRALINEPSLVLADEPTGNLDTAMGEEIGQSLLSYARRRGSIVIVATHNERMAQLCDRILLLKEGRIH